MRKMFGIILFTAALAGCGPTVKVEPIEVTVKPIHVTVDINIKVDRQLEKFFDFEDDSTGAKEGNK